MNRQSLTILCAASVVFAVGSCGDPEVETAAPNAVNSGAPVANSDQSTTNQATTSNRTMETGEPDKYSATLHLKAESVGAEKLAAPTMTAEVARDGEKRRVEFLLPNNERVIYLNLGETRYLVMPGRRQYAELDADSVGFELPRLMMPDQIVEYLKGRNDYQRIGEENFRGRTVVKYRTAGTTETNTNAAV